MKKTRIYLFLVMTLLLLLGSACGGGGDQVSDADAVLTQAAEIAAQAQTQTAEAVPPATDTPLPVPTDTPTLQPVISPTGGIVPTNAFAITASPGAGATLGASTQMIFPPTSTVAVNNQPAQGDCYKAAFESDGTPYDHTAITGGKTFTKNWRIKNIGTCEWTSDGVYLKWLGTEKKELNQPWEQNVAEIFGQGSVIPIVTETVYPGGHLDIKVDFTAPVPRTTKIEWKAYFCLGTPGGLVYFNGGTIWFWIVATNPD
jgi:hypothetical protein